MQYQSTGYTGPNGLYGNTGPYLTDQNHPYPQTYLFHGCLEDGAGGPGVHHDVVAWPILQGDLQRGEAGPTVP